MKKGQALIIAIFAMIILSMLGIMAINLVSTESVSTSRNLMGIQALYLAESGINFTMATSLSASTDWNDLSDLGPVSLNPGTFSIHYIAKSISACTLESTGISNGISRVIRTTLTKKPRYPGAFDYVIYHNNNFPHTAPRLWIESNVSGEIFSNSDVGLLFGKNINGMISVTEGHNVVTWHPTQWQVVDEPAAFPVFDGTSYQDKINAYDALIPSGNPGNKTYSGNTIITLNGNTITADWFEANDNVVIKGYGTIAAKHDIAIQGHSIVSPEGGTIVLAAGQWLAVSDYALVRAGTHLYTRNNTLGVLDHGTVDNSLLLSNKRISVYNNGMVTGESVIFAGSAADMITVFDDAKIHGSILSDSTIFLGGSGPLGIDFTGIIYAPSHQVGVWGTNFKGSLVCDTILANVIGTSQFFWDYKYLPGTFPVGLQLPGSPNFISLDSWKEIY
ncbi:MAG: hypothetical protein WCV91_06755 [Candidatus Margulisiibacteriota bacterium]